MNNCTEKSGKFDFSFSLFTKKPSVHWYGPYLRAYFWYDFCRISKREKTSFSAEARPCAAACSAQRSCSRWGGQKAGKKADTTSSHLAWVRWAGARMGLRSGDAQPGQQSESWGRRQLFWCRLHWSTAVDLGPSAPCQELSLGQCHRTGIWKRALLSSFGSALLICGAIAYG